jgi:hypothetical protein
VVASVRSGGVTHTLAAISFRDAGGVLRSVAVGQIRNAANVLKRFTSSLSVGLSSSDVHGKVNSGSSVTIQTQVVQAIPDGGAGAYSYLWALTGSSGGTWVINSASSNTTTFSGGPCGPGDFFTATFHCTVTDAAGNTAVTGTVTATVTNIGYNISGGGGPLP